MADDLAIGTIVMVGDHLWRKGSRKNAVLAFLFGKRQRFVHLKMRCTVSWWRGHPYLIGFREARK